MTRHHLTNMNLLMTYKCNITYLNKHKEIWFPPYAFTICSCSFKVMHIIITYSIISVLEMTSVSCLLVQILHTLSLSLSAVIQKQFHLVHRPIIFDKLRLNVHTSFMKFFIVHTQLLFSGPFFGVPYFLTRLFTCQLPLTRQL